MGGDGLMVNERQFIVKIRREGSVMEGNGGRTRMVTQIDEGRLVTRIL